MLRTSHCGCGLGRLAAVVILSAVTVLGKDPQTTIVRGGHVFDSLTGTMLAGRTILIEGERIRSIGTSEKPVSIPRGARVIDARGKYVIPGLIDAHVHLVHVLDFAHVTGDEILPLFLANGVTSVRDIGDEVVAEKLVARYAEAHPELSPRVFLASPLIDKDPPFHRDIGRAVTDPDKVPEFVADMAAWGVTTLKIYVGTERQVGRRIIQEGHRQGLVVAGHLGKYSAQDAVSDGIDCLEHIWSVFDYIFPPDALRLPDRAAQQLMQPSELETLRRRVQEQRSNLDLNSPITQELIASLAQRKVFVDPTLVVFRNQFLLVDLPEVFEHPDNSFVPERLKRWWSDYRIRRNPPADTLDLRRRELKKFLELTGMLHRAGVPLLAGTDSPEPFTPPGFALHKEIELFVESGLSPAAALQSATINNARVLKMDAQLGSIGEGKLADIVILNANPLEDIKNTRTVFQVIKNGAILDPKSLLKMVPAN